jgi:restriction system protein
MPTFYRVHLGSGGKYANECIAGGYIGVSFRIPIDFTGAFGESWREFNKRFIPQYQQIHADSSRIAAGIAGGAIYVIGQQMQNGDYVISPMGDGTYRVGRISGDFHFAPNQNLPHRRGVQWLNTIYQRDQLSAELVKSIHSQMTVINLSESEYDEEMHRLINIPIAPPPAVDTAYEFALEKHLEEFLIKHWNTLPIGQEYDIFKDGQQFPTDTGPIDILAISKDQKRLLVVELKKGRTSDATVGQILRYMGFVKANLLESHQEVHGLIIAYSDDQSIRNALSVVPNVQFAKYQVNFSLEQK